MRKQKIIVAIITIIAILISLALLILLNYLIYRGFLYLTGNENKALMFTLFTR